MKMNVGNADRAARVLAGIVLVGLAGSGVIGAWGFIGFVPVLTGAFGYCPLYKVLGFSSCPMRKP